MAMNNMFRYALSPNSTRPSARRSLSWAQTSSSMHRTTSCMISVLSWHPFLMAYQCILNNKNQFFFYIFSRFLTSPRCLLGKFEKDFWHSRCMWKDFWHKWDFVSVKNLYARIVSIKNLSHHVKKIDFYYVVSRHHQLYQCKAWIQHN